MAQADALRMVDHVKKRLVDMAMAENYVRDAALSEACRRVWSEGRSEDGLVSEIWVEGMLPGELSGDTLTSLTSEGLFPADLCSHIAGRGVFPVERRLYNHQSEVIRTAAQAELNSRPGFVVTAGTGLGKTEAFLLPVLSDLWSAPSRQHGGGMRCLMLYPMNALIADQVDRVYRWLRGQNRLTVFHFTSETPENKHRADGLGIEEWDACRMRTREEARGHETHLGEPIVLEPFGLVPDIVITNYSMLEYMLCRPQDACFFGRDLRCIILDEAHLYTGTLAAEITMLLRRVRERCGVKSEQVLHIATSATLGGSEDDLRDYASTLFSIKKDATTVIQGRHGCVDLGESESPPATGPDLPMLANHASVVLSTMEADEEQGGDKLIDDDPAAVASLSVLMQALTSEAVVRKAQEAHGACPARFLHAALCEAPLARRIARLLRDEHGHVVSLTDLAKLAFPDAAHQVQARQAAALLLRLGAAARNRADELPLVPHRLHFLVRAPQGLSMCLNSDCCGPDDFKGPNLGCLQSTTDRCRHCGHVTLPLHRCRDCGQWALAGHELSEDCVIEPGYLAPPSAQTFYLLTSALSSGLTELIVDTVSGEFHNNSNLPGTRLWKAPATAADPHIQRCPTCGTSEQPTVWTPGDDSDPTAWRNRACGALIGGRGFALSVVGETVLHDLPPYGDSSREWKPARGRRLLCFSDSRGAAARLGPLLTRQHELNVIRAAIARCAADLASEAVADDYREEIAHLMRKLSEPNQPAAVREKRLRDLKEKESELTRAQAGTPFELFASMFAKRDEVKELLYRELGDRQKSRAYCQTTWEGNASAVAKCAEALVATEFDRPLRTAVSVEAVGLVEIAYPGIQDLQIPGELERRLPRQARAAISEAWPDILHLLLDSLRVDHCMGWSEVTAARKWMDESPLKFERWATRTKGGWRARAFVGATTRQLRRRFAENVLRTAGCPDGNSSVLSEGVLCAVFDQLYAAAGTGALNWLEIKAVHQVNEKDETDRALRILLDRLSVRRPLKLFRCDQTGTVWSHSALRWAPIEGCLGHLSPVTPEQLNDDPRWRRARLELMSSSVFGIGLWAEEHSAQLDPSENRRLQDLFREGIRNVLSSTTTMELGIDIGGLNGVLLGNVPPAAANHRQRAGRAGRRADGSAVVVTFARDSAFDREVYRRFDVFLTKPLPRPVVFLDRSKIVERHLFAVLLADFFQGRRGHYTGTMDAFGRMGQFCGVQSLPDRWRTATSPKPDWAPDGVGYADEFVRFLDDMVERSADYRDTISTLTLGTQLSGVAQPDGFRAFVARARSSFEHALDEWRADLGLLHEAWNEIPIQPSGRLRGIEMSKANAIRYQVKALCEITAIEWLAGRRFLPRYGFPINLQRLKVRETRDSEKGEKRLVPHERYRLERSSLLALSEYVPGSRVLVGGRVAISRGISKHWTDATCDRALGLNKFALECAQGHIYVKQDPGALCPRCGQPPVRRQQLLFPRFGYTTAAWEAPKRETDFEHIGESAVFPTAFAERSAGQQAANFGGIRGLAVTCREEAQLLVRNAGSHDMGFALCTKCGFAMSEDARGQGAMDLPRDRDMNFASHLSIFSSRENDFCWRRNEPEPPVLRNRVIAAEESTDMLLIEWPGAASANRNAVYSLGRALLLAGCRMLELSERELGVETVPLDCPACGIVIYDTTPGGAGHCAELVKLGRSWVERARDVLYVDAEHHKRCQRGACLDCILDFSGQHRWRRLDRKGALELLEGTVNQEIPGTLR